MNLTRAADFADQLDQYIEEEAPDRIVEQAARVIKFLLEYQIKNAKPAKDYRNVPMPLEHANRAVESYRLSGKTARAVRMFLSGICETKTEAAREAGGDAALVSRALGRMTVTRRCDCCGQNVADIAITRS